MPAWFWILYGIGALMAATVTRMDGGSLIASLLGGIFWPKMVARGLVSKSRQYGGTLRDRRKR